MLALVLGSAGVARAEGMLPGGATLKFNKLLLHEDNSADLAEPKITPDSLWLYFNQAHCVCSQFNDAAPIPGFNEGTFDYEVTVENLTTPIAEGAEVWVGTGCNTDMTTQRDADCTKITTTSSISAIEASGSTTVDIPIFKFMTPKLADRQMGACSPRKLQATTWLLVDSPADGTIDYSESAVIETDSEPPPLPTGFKAIGAEAAIEISWTPPTDVSDVAYYQALCASGPNADTPAKASGITARYETAQQLCGAQSTITLMPNDITTVTDPDAGVDSLSLGELANLNPAFICGESTSATATSMRIEGLKNGTPYTVVLLVIDKYGNPAGTYFTSRLTPIPATDFWEDLQGQGSGVEGGFCLIAQAYGDDNPLTGAMRRFRDETLASTAFGRALTKLYYDTGVDLPDSIAVRIFAAIHLFPLIVVALLWHLLTLPGLLALIALMTFTRRASKKWRARLATAAVLGTLVLVPTRAHAQTPYWENETLGDTQDELSVGDPLRVKWHAGLRLGPFVPGIDSQLNMPAPGSAGPYEQMFGGYKILPVLDVERFFWRGFGQAGIGISIGYMSKSAKAWQAGSTASQGDLRPRSEGDTNKFRLFPFSVNAIYRFTYLDDEFGVPIVPYAKLGGAYYVWWIVAPNGDFASTCKDGTDTMGCAKTTAAGASMGVIGTIGLSIRAERIDESAARSMRESGIEHAGFYGEYSVGKVDGFGSDKKLSVGDSTWFAGVDFEF
ncbi:MAG TPA: MXAN_2562 family outer membrane beta-barrel protein [Kofleriaceae bacterium]|nr:MXAN_2562 family outer membrane beta-barrel protein [Kofleriaceae bacterium]